MASHSTQRANKGSFLSPFHCIPLRRSRKQKLGVDRESISSASSNCGQQEIEKRLTSGGQTRPATDEDNVDSGFRMGNGQATNSSSITSPPLRQRHNSPARSAQVSYNPGKAYMRAESHHPMQQAAPGNF